MLKLGRMVPDISPLDRSALDCSISPGGAVGARLLKSSNRFTAYSSYQIELNLSRMVLEVSRLDRSASDCSIAPRGAVEGARFEIFKSIHSIQFSSD